MIGRRRIGEPAAVEIYAQKLEPFIRNGFSFAQITATRSGMKYGYAPASTDRQSVDAQKREAIRGRDHDGKLVREIARS